MNIFEIRVYHPPRGPIDWRKLLGQHKHGPVRREYGIVFVRIRSGTWTMYDLITAIGDHLRDCSGQKPLIDHKIIRGECPCAATD